MSKGSCRLERKENMLSLALCLAIAAAALAICSRSSPLYPINDWVDSNCFFTVGKAMMSGKTVYLDIYEQKGIFLYFLHALAYLVSPRSFFGVYLIEVASFAAFLYITYRISRLFSGRAASVACLAPLSLAVLCTRAFCQGDSAEQLLMPLLLYPVYCLLRSLAEGRGGVPTKRETAAVGVLFTLTLLTKFTLIGVFFGCVVALILICIIRREMALCLSRALYFLAGAAAAAVPAVVYLAANGALPAFFEVYFYNNMFLYPLYSGDYTVWQNLLYSVLTNPVCFAAIAGGLAFTVASIRKKEASVALPVVWFFSFFFVYVGGRFYEYYALGVAFLAATGAAALAYFAERATGLLKNARRERIVSVALAAVATVSAIGLCLPCSSNTFLLGKAREETWQYKFAAIIERSDEKTLVNYGALDLGLYTATGIVPDERFFCHLNIELDEMEQALDEAVSERRAKFVVFRGGASINSVPKLITQNYTLVARETSHLEFEGSTATYYLFERKQSK